MQILTTRPDIYLSPFTSSDSTACVELLQEKDVHEGLLLMPYPYGPGDFETWFSFVAEETALLQSPGQLAIRQSPGSFLGGIGTKDLVLGHRCEIGYWLGKPYWGQGVMPTVVGPFCEYLHETFSLVRITATVFANNPASMRVLDKCGFQREGILRKHYRKHGRFIDGVLFAKVW
ncbi:GNAT family protein [Bremerella sp. JC817]|uniref:GNAT family N-acetyltransferase n=1 Tax=Bremerella sp. JC817 TaxID=3231756 RepID=UPI00345840F5